jgi:hypothetical protein
MLNLCNKVTPGQWWLDPDSSITVRATGNKAVMVASSSQADAAFVVMAHIEMRTLIVEVARLRAENLALKEEATRR